MNLKTNLVALSAVSTMLFSAVAHADAPTGELLVKGALTVPGCTVSAGNDGVYDHGLIGSSTIQSGTANTSIGKLSNTWTASCDAATYLGFSVTDNRADSASEKGSMFFGLGHVNETGKLGFYQVLMENATVDGKASNVYATNTKKIDTSTSAASMLLNNSAGFQHGWAEGTTKQAMGKVFTADLVVDTYLAGADTMNGRPTDMVDLDGSTTLTFSFGL
ncbi:DUF1120 domain-containing protein [Burkholderia sp. 4701]|nr:DUF1120 domain-containing protein [Burkholderia sp. 4701]MXN80421.1 DUF1120 domain-containing protein [Burkholderia sp. 4812]